MFFMKWAHSLIDAAFAPTACLSHPERGDYVAKCEKMKAENKKNGKRFGSLQKSQYLCNRNSEMKLQ